MRSLFQSIPGDPLSLIVGNVPIPEPPGNGEMLIRVHCAAINRRDLTNDENKNAIENFVPGIEVSGTIVSLGEDCHKKFLVNDTVMALLPSGGYAEFCVVDQRTVIPCPSPSLNVHRLAAIPVAFMTAYQLCFWIGRCERGECVVLHAASSSVGQAALQMLVRKGVKVFATVTQERKRQCCLDLGASNAFVINPDSPFFTELIRTYNDGQLVDCIIDPVGAAYLDQNIDLLAFDGRLVLYDVLTGGSVADPILLEKLLNKRLSIATSTLHTRSQDYLQELITAISKDGDALPAVAAGEITVHVDRTFEMEEVLKAHEYVRRGENIGKVILSITSTASAIEFFGKELNSMAQRNKMRHAFIRK